MKFTTAVSIFVLTAGQVPIPKTVPGWLYDPNGNGFPDSAIEVDVFVDLQCPGCKMAWPGLRDMAIHYGNEVHN